MRSRDLALLLAGVMVALVTLFVSWRFGFIFFLLPLFFVWLWGGEKRVDDDGPAASEEEPPMGEEEPPMGEEGPGPEPPAEPGVDGEGI